MVTDRLLKHHTYIKTGGPADELVIAKTVDKLIHTVKSCRQKHQKYYILGGGSNIIFSDAGFRGTVILNRTDGYSFDKKTAILTAESGCPLNLLVNQSVSLGLSGLEWYLGLPGSLGGAIYNNSHFKDHLIGDIIQSVTALTESGDIVTFKSADLDFSYDHSRFHHTQDIILSAVLELHSDESNLVSLRAKEALNFRSSRQPLSSPSSGCIFKNPQNGPSAGQLIDQAGLKNTRIGGAVVSSVHANFIVNDASATSADILKLTRQIQLTVLQQSGVKLEPEVFFINEYGERID